MKIKTFFLVVSVTFLVSLVLPTVSLGADSLDIEKELIITEVKLGGGDEIVFADSTKAKDFVEIANISDQALNLDGWVMEYAKSGFDFANCSLSSWSGLDQASVTPLFGGLTGNTVSAPIARQLNDNSSGALRLVDPNGVVHDLIGWGASAPCYEKQPTAIPGSGKSILRYLDCDTSIMIDTDNNYLDFAVNQEPNPGDIASVYASNCSQGENQGENGNDSSSDGTSSDCEGIVLSEVLPNPSGSDSGSEFIELHNPTNKSISLKNCKLLVSYKNAFYTFGQEDLKPGEYRAFYDSDTSLGLVNSSEATIWILSHEDVELYEATYPADMDDDVSYALFGNEWKSTYIPTPNAENKLQATKPCPAGQFRSSETNRCRSRVLASSLLKPCDPGKIRNPATNRCRSTSLASTLKPCDADQFRNPETNRCKMINSGSSLKPCRPGQERNPETNRCRKIEEAALGSSLNTVKDVPAPSIGNQVSWWIAGASFACAVSYAVFEWRKELFSGLSNLKSKIAPSPATD